MILILLTALTANNFINGVNGKFSLAFNKIVNGRAVSGILQYYRLTV